ncbi:protein SpAN-like [Macrobrachium nipponense]|uniref:protein SpAN-like n=1 Tax=Macrobrachium nipponense TaxID=159736 RepID=UPI0030C86591
MAYNQPTIFALVPQIGTTEFETPIPFTLIDDENETLTPKPIILDKRARGFEELNPTHVEGEELYQSDIRLTPEQRVDLVQRKAIILSQSYRWPVGTDGFVHVPYVFGDSNVDRTAVLAGMAHWEERTCIKFDEANDQNQPHLRFILGSGCWSYIGRMWTWAGQDISIGSGCTGLGTVAHEIGHAMGFFHEQSRNDRDSYVAVNTGNIISGREHNFDKAADTEVSNYSVPYDYSSLMHYGGAYFTKNGHLTISTKYPLAQELIGSRSGLSHRDTLLANRMYPCIDKWVADCGLTSDPCQNEGYLGSSCSCVCPSHTSGTYCENIIGDYYDTVVSSCSETITSETTVSSPNYPSNYDSSLQCIKWIRAPTCYRVRLTVNDFRMYSQVTCSDGTSCCYWDGLEIRTGNLYDGAWYCGQMISPGSVFLSDSNQMILFFKTTTSYYKGFQGNIEFVQDPSCTVPTTTTTTTPTTTTTTEATSTTITPTTTTTTTAATTTTTLSSSTASPNTCQLENYNGIHYWTSPNFGQGDYPNDAFCNMSVSTARPAMALLTFSPFQLQGKVKRSCRDFVSFTYPYDVQKVFCGDRTGKKQKLPYFSFRGMFRSNGAITDAGFNISMQQKDTSCHKVISLTSLGESGIFKTPRYPNVDRNRRRMCEIWIIAPTSYRVRLDFLGFDLNDPCKSNNVVINPNGDREYRKATGSTRHCGTTLPPQIFSIQNEIDLVYQASQRNRGFKLQYTVVV